MIEAPGSALGAGDTASGSALIEQAQPQSHLTGTRPWRLALMIVLVLWIAVVAVRGAALVLQAFGVAVAGPAQLNWSTPDMIWAAIVVCGSCLIAALITRRFRPALTLPVTIVIGAIPLLVASLAAGAVGSLVATIVLFALAWVVGQAVLWRLPASAGAAIVRVPLAVASGVALLATIFSLLAALRLLGTVAVLVSVAALLVLVVIADGWRLHEGWTELRAWRPEAPTWFEAIVAGITVGLLAFALLSTVVPEKDTDPIRQHLPIAREIWRSGTLIATPQLSVAREPIAAHVLNAVAYGFGDLRAVQMANAGIGLTAIAGVAGLAWLCAGRIGATVAAAVFASMPVVLWLLGHAYLDLVPVLFTVAAVLAILLWQRDGSPGWLIGAGFLAGTGAAAKFPTMALAILGLGVALFLVGRGPWRWRGRLGAAVLFGLGAAVIVLPWLWRSYTLVGTIPRLAALRDQIIAIWPGAAAFLSAVPTPSPDGGAAVAPVAAPLPVEPAGPAAPELSLLDYLRLPWDLTFQADRFSFPIIESSEVGIALLMLLPLVLLAPRTRALAFMSVTALTIFLIWCLTPFHVPRHLLPALAIASALAGIGVASAVGSVAVPRGDAASALGWRPLAAVSRAGTIVGCVAAILLLLPVRVANLPVSVVVGQESPEEFLARKLPLIGVFAAINDQFPPGELVGYFGREGLAAQIYTDATLAIYTDATPLGDSAEEVLASLERLGIRYFIWNRVGTGAKGLENWRSTLLSTPFLRDHTRILASETDAYLFAVDPEQTTPWGAESLNNLLRDPGLDQVGKDDAWTTTGTVRARRGVVSMRSDGSLAQEVPVTPGQGYLFQALMACDAADDLARMTFRWIDSSGREIAATTDQVFPGMFPSEQFLWRVAPERATSVRASITTPRCRIDNAALYEVP